MTIGGFYRISSHSDQYPLWLSSVYKHGRRIWDRSYALAQSVNVYEEVKQDIVIGGAMDRRLQAVAGKTWNLEPGDKRPISDLAAELLTFPMQQIPRFPEARKLLAEFVFHGSSYARKRGRFVMAAHYDGAPRRWYHYTDLQHSDRRNFKATAHDPGEEFDEMVVRWEKRNVKRSTWEEVTSWKGWVRALYNLRESSVNYGQGLLDELYHYWYFKSRIMEEGLKGAERWAQGLLHAKVDGLRDAEHGRPNTKIMQEWLDTLEAMRSRHVLAHDKSDEIAVLDGPSQGHQIVTEFLDYLDKWIIVRIEGSYLPTGGDGEGGAYALGRVQSESSESVIDYDRELLSAIITEQIVKPLFLLNRATMMEIDPALGDAAIPVFNIKSERKKDPKGRAEVFEIANRYIELPKRHVHEELDIPVPTDDEDVIPVHQEVPQGMPWTDTLNGSREGHPAMQQQPGQAKPPSAQESSAAYERAVKNGDRLAASRLRRKMLAAMGDTDPVPDISDDEWAEMRSAGGAPGGVPATGDPSGPPASARARAAGDFDESKHKRDEGGKFSPDEKSSGPEDDDYPERTDALIESPYPEDHHSEYFSNADPRGVDALLNYTASEYVDMNDCLRGTGPCDLVAEQNERLTKLIDQAPAFAEPITTFRGVSGSPEQIAETARALKAAADSGNSVRMPGFQSTSTNPAAAAEFTTGKGAGMLFQIKTQKGLAVQPVSFYKDEKEILLGHDSKFTVSSVTRSKRTGLYVVEVEAA